MHSRIFNLSDEVMSEDRIYDLIKYFNGMVDYVVEKDDEDSNNSIDWFDNSTGIKVDRNGDFEISSEFAKQHWDKIFDEVSKIEMNVDNLYKIVNLINDTCGLYVYYGDELYTLDGFMRDIIRGYIEEHNFHIYQVFDYHY